MVEPFVCWSPTCGQVVNSLNIHYFDDRKFTICEHCCAKHELRAKPYAPGEFYRFQAIGLLEGPDLLSKRPQIEPRPRAVNSLIAPTSPP